MRTKNFTTLFNHNGKRLTFNIKGARSFEEAEQIVELSFKNKDYSFLDFIVDLDDNEKMSRVRSAFYNGEIEQLVLSIPIWK